MKRRVRDAIAYDKVKAVGARQKDAGRAVTTRAFRERDDATRSTAYHRGGDLKEMVVNKTRNVVI